MQVGIAEEYAAKLRWYQEELHTAAYGDDTREWAHLVLTKARACPGCCSASCQKQGVLACPLSSCQKVSCTLFAGGAWSCAPAASSLATRQGITGMQTSQWQV